MDTNDHMRRSLPAQVRRVPEETTAPGFLGRLSVLREHLTDAALASLASKTTLAGAATSGLGWMASNSIMGWVGIVVALSGLAVNIHYRRREDRRRDAEHREFMRRITQCPGRGDGGA